MVVHTYNPSTQEDGSKFKASLGYRVRVLYPQIKTK